eukprot:1201794-Rhodomonas_salina.5
MRRFARQWRRCAAQFLLNCAAAQRLRAQSRSGYRDTATNYVTEQTHGRCNVGNRSESTLCPAESKPSSPRPRTKAYCEGRLLHLISRCTAWLSRCSPAVGTGPGAQARGQRVLFPAAAKSNQLNQSQETTALWCAEWTEEEQGYGFWPFDFAGAGSKQNKHGPSTLCRLCDLISHLVVGSRADNLATEPPLVERLRRNQRHYARVSTNSIWKALNFAVHV